MFRSAEPVTYFPDDKATTDQTAASCPSNVMDVDWPMPAMAQTRAVLSQLPDRTMPFWVPGARVLTLLCVLRKEGRGFE